MITTYVSLMLLDNHLISLLDDCNNHFFPEMALSLRPFLRRSAISHYQISLRLQFLVQSNFARFPRESWVEHDLWSRWTMNMTPQFKKWKKAKIILPSLRTLSTQIPGKDKPLCISTVVDFITKTWFVLIFLSWMFQTGKREHRFQLGGWRWKVATRCMTPASEICVFETKIYKTQFS